MIPSLKSALATSGKPLDHYTTCAIRLAGEQKNDSMLHALEAGG